MSATRLHAIARDILQRVALLPDPSRFAYADLALARPVACAQAFERLVDSGHVERVHEGAGRWSYRLTERGRDVADGRAKLKLSEDA